MNIVVVTEYLRAKPWATGRWACAIAAGLAERGHRVTVLCDGTETTTPFGDVEVVQRNPLRRHTQRQPLRFARWAHAQTEHRSPDVAISCVHTVATHHWFPVGPWVVDEFDDLLGKRSPVSFALSLAHQPWLPQAWVAARRARSLGHTPRSPTAIGFVSMLDRDDDAALAARRARAREVLGLSGRVVVVSATDPQRRDITRLLEAVDALDAMLLIAGGRAHAITTWADENKFSHRVRSVGPTSRMADVLAAADVAVVPSPSDGTARFAADALRVGRPVICAAGGASARLAAEYPGAAMRCDGNWSDVLARAFDGDSASVARAAGRDLGFGTWLDRFERKALGGSL